MNIRNKDNQTLSTEGVDPKTVEFVTQAFGGLTAQISAAIGTSMNPIKESITTLTEQVEKSSTEKENNGQSQNQSQNGNNNQSNGGGQPNAGNENQQGTDPALLKILTGITDRLDGMENDSKASKAAKTSKQLTEAYFEANHPTMKGKAAMAARIAGTNPKDEDEVKAAFDTEKAYMIDMQGEDAVTKMLAADVKSEGGDSGTSDDVEAELKAKAEKLEGKLPKSA
jgi:uncharacterized membrane protein